MDKLKLELIRWIAEQQDLESLEALHERMNELAYERRSDSLVIGLTPNGREITKSRFVSSIVQAESSIRHGEYLTISELERQSENW